jgi:hypothetical protein
MLNYLGYPNDLGNLHLFLFVCLCGLFMSTGSLPGVGSAQPCSWGSLSAPVAWPRQKDFGQRFLFEMSQVRKPHWKGQEEIPSQHASLFSCRSWVEESCNSLFSSARRAKDTCQQSPGSDPPRESTHVPVLQVWGSWSGHGKYPCRFCPIIPKSKGISEFHFSIENSLMIGKFGIPLFFHVPVGKSRGTVHQSMGFPIKFEVWSEIAQTPI